MRKGKANRVSERALMSSFLLHVCGNVSFEEPPTRLMFHVDANMHVAEQGRNGLRVCGETREVSLHMQQFEKMVTELEENIAMVSSEVRLFRHKSSVGV